MTKSIFKAVEILKVLATDLHRLTDISQSLNLNKGTTRRLLDALEKTGLVIQDSVSHRYYLGNLFLDFSSNPEIAHSALVNFAKAEMENLSKLTNETVSLHIRIGTQRICLEELPSSQVIKFMAGKGNSAPIYTGAAGKILLQALPEGELAILLENIKLVPFGPNTITDKTKLEKELKMVRKQGYALSFSERVPESAAVAALISNYIIPVALSVIGPEKRIFSKMDLIKPELIASADRVSKKLEGLY